MRCFSYFLPYYYIPIKYCSSLASSLYFLYFSLNTPPSNLRPRLYIVQVFLYLIISKTGSRYMLAKLYCQNLTLKPFLDYKPDNSSYMINPTSCWIKTKVDVFI